MFWRTLALFLLLLDTKGWNLMFVGWTKGDCELEPLIIQFQVSLCQENNLFVRNNATDEKLT